MSILSDYKTENNMVFKWDNNRNAFRFVGHLQGRTLIQFIEDYQTNLIKVWKL